jgi:hypothetical protein
LRFWYLSFIAEIAKANRRAEKEKQRSLLIGEVEYFLMALK